MRVGIALILLVSAAAAAPVPKEVKKNDFASLVGTWVDAGTCVGLAAPKPAGGYSWKFDPDGAASILWPTRKPTEGVKFTIDSTASPKTFDWITPWGEWYGVYELKGDTFTLYMPTTSGKERCKELKPHPNVTSHTFQRFESSK